LPLGGRDTNGENNLTKGHMKIIKKNKIVNT